MSQTWTLKKGTNEKGILAKFPDPIPFDNPKVNLYMYRQEEEITEKDPVNIEDKTAFIRKKKKRRSLRAKSTIHLEEPPKQNPLEEFERINVEGNVVDSNVEGGVSSAKYALLQVVKKNGSVDPSNMIINVILIGDSYHFKNIVSTRVEKSLEELDNEYEKQQRLQKESNKRYHRISSALNRTTETNQEEEGIPSAFGSGSVAGKKKGIGGSKKIIDGFRGHMNDGGQDVDEERNFDEYNGVGLEYEENLSDDEDDAELLQGVDEAREENDVDGGDIFEDDDLESDSSSEADDEDDDEIDSGDSKDKALAQASSELSDYIISKKAAQAINTSTVSMEDGMIVVNHAANITNNEQSQNTTQLISTSEKRKGSPEIVDDEKNKKPRVATNTNQGPVLTEEYVKQTIIRMGGRVNIKDLRDELKKPIKKMGDAGKTKFLDIVRKVTQSEEDAVFGKILV
eukprot:CAMPEP_0174824280 /NCGR_PEP_ID=MMETSP1107-20130205/32581_1 /TAXON_ID=36770 /ORGANISM="Paraphysomonas vestita, Strain GFlagA" /LENGTH=455 /DNA_ID=CAMNT_0016050775 /DNA_START=414 /DNA_END=1778 /DNA_ORIENTATION=-